jgi:hypothetical protein
MSYERRAGAGPAERVPDILAVARAAGLAPTHDYGDEWRVPCPLPGHDEDEHPSCSLNAATQEFNCLVCDRGGGSPEFARILKEEHVSVISVAGSPAAKKPSKASQCNAARIWELLSTQDLRARRALNRRWLRTAPEVELAKFLTEDFAGINTSTDNYLRWLARLGFRVAVPMRDVSGKTVALALRNVDRDARPKVRFLGTPAKAFFGRPRNVLRHRRALLVEGLTDYLTASLAFIDDTETTVIGFNSTGGFDEDVLAEVFRDFEGELFLFPHNDMAGMRLMAKAANALTDMKRRWRWVSPLVETKSGDLSDLLAQENGDYDEYFAKVAEAMAAALPQLTPEVASLMASRAPERERPSPPEPEWVGEPPAFCPPPTTALVSRQLLLEVSAILDASTARRRAALASRPARGATPAPSAADASTQDRTKDERPRPRVAADALLGLQLDTALRFMDRGKGAFAGPEYLTKKLKVSSTRLHAAAKWLAARGVSRTTPTPSDGRRHWQVAKPITETEATCDYVPVPSAAVFELKPLDFFALATLHDLHELAYGGDAKDYRRELLPRTGYMNMPMATILSVMRMGPKRATACLLRLEAKRYFSAKVRKLSPPISTNPLGGLRRKPSATPEESP